MSYFLVIPAVFLVQFILDGINTDWIYTLTKTERIIARYIAKTRHPSFRAKDDTLRTAFKPAVPVPNDARWLTRNG